MKHKGNTPKRPYLAHTQVRLGPRGGPLGLRDVELRMDSELVVKQINGEYRVKQPVLADLKGRLDGLLAGFRAWRVRHVPRAENSETDRLANEALDAA